VLLGAEQGPRFGGFVAVYGVPDTVVMIDAALAASSSRAPDRALTRPVDARMNGPPSPVWTSGRISAHAQHGLTAAVFAALFSLSAPARQPPRMPRGDAIRQVISDQISALRADDFEQAFTYASPSIKRLFREPRALRPMVRDGYPMVWRPADVRFTVLERARRPDRPERRVTDERGALHVLDYEMIETERGWEINGVRVRRPSDAAA
jgi:hypothetical protein